MRLPVRLRPPYVLRPYLLIVCPSLSEYNRFVRAVCNIPPQIFLLQKENFRKSSLYRNPWEIFYSYYIIIIGTEKKVNRARKILYLFYFSCILAGISGDYSFVLSITHKREKVPFDRYFS